MAAPGTAHVDPIRQRSQYGIGLADPADGTGLSMHRYGDRSFALTPWEKNLAVDDALQMFVSVWLDTVIPGLGYDG